MTSIHAAIPSDLRNAVSAAKGRGEIPGTVIREDKDQRPSLKGKSVSSSSVVMKKLPQRITSTQSAPVRPLAAQNTDESAGEDDEISASKENDPMLSPLPVPTQSPRRPTLAKRPLSDLPCPTESECDSADSPCMSSSEQNIVNNIPLSIQTAPEVSHQGSQLAERNEMVNFTGRGLKEASMDGLVVIFDDERASSDDSRPAKRVCSDEGKENVADGPSVQKPSRPLHISSMPSKPQFAPARKASAPGSLGAGSVKTGKGRVGLRRL